MRYARQIFTRYLTQSDERQLMSTVKQHADIYARRDAAWMQLLRQTGIRVGTLAGLNVHHAHDAAREGRLTYGDAIAKRGRGGSVYVNKKARAALRDLLRIRRELGYAAIPDEALIMSRKHRRMSVRSFQDRMRTWCTIAGLNVEASPHWFRHTLAKRIQKQSTAADPRGVIGGVLNHANPRSTMIYTLPDREDEALAMEEAS